MFAGSLVVLSLLLFADCKKKQEKAPEAKVKVAAITVSSGLIQAGESFSGTIAAGMDAQLSFLDTGTVVDVYVNEGDAVQKGQALAKIDGSIEQDAYTGALAKSNQAKDARARYEPMYKDGNLPEIKWVEINTDLAQANAALAAAKKKLDDTILRAPFAGSIGNKKIDVGSNVMPGQPVIELISTDSIYALVYLPSTKIHNIKKGTPASIVVDGSGAVLNGVVDQIGITADPVSRTFEVKTLVENPPADVRSGMLCTVSLTPVADEAAQTQGLVIPAQALAIDANNKEFVYIIDPDTNRAYRQYIVTDGFEPNGIVVTSGLNENDIIVTSGIQKLDDGMLVEY
jgi:RND family efflux transporter MFP subunit